MYTCICGTYVGSYIKLQQRFFLSGRFHFTAHGTGMNPVRPNFSISIYLCSLKQEKNRLSPSQQYEKKNNRTDSGTLWLRLWCIQCAHTYIAIIIIITTQIISFYFLFLDDRRPFSVRISQRHAYTLRGNRLYSKNDKQFYLFCCFVYSCTHPFTKNCFLLFLFSSSLSAIVTESEKERERD